MDRDKLKILKLLALFAEKESDRAWVRYATMLYANTGMIAILSLILSSEFLSNRFAFVFIVILSLVGIVSAIAWLKINSVSHYYEQRWRHDMDALTKSEETLKEWVRGRSDPRISWPFPKKSGLFYFNILPYLFLIVWIIVPVAGIILGIDP